MIQQDFPRTPSPVYQKPVSRPTKAEVAQAQAHAQAQAQAQAHAQAHAHSRELAFDQMQQQRSVRQQQAAAAAAAQTPSPMYYPEPVEQQLNSRMHSLSLNDSSVLSSCLNSDLTRGLTRLHSF